MPTAITPQLIQASQAIHDALKGSGTDEAMLIAAITRVPAHDLLNLQQSYKATFGKDLVKAITSETSGKFQQLLVALIKGSFMLDAEALHGAVKGLGTDEKTIIELLSARSNSDIENLKAAYKAKFDRDLEKDIAGDLSGPLKHWCVAILAGARDELNAYCDVEGDVKILYAGGAGKIGTDPAAFISVFATRGIGHLQRVFGVYTQRYGTTLEQVVKNEFNGKMQDAMLHFVRSVTDYPGWVAAQFRNAYEGIGSDEKKLIRLVVRTRNPLLTIVKQAYQRTYNESLIERTKSETSGDYRKALLALLEQ